MSPGLSRRLRPPFSVRAHVLGLILVTLLPLLAFSAFLVLRSAEHEQAILAETVQDRTRGIARDLEQELSSLRAQLFVIVDAEPESPAILAALRAHAGAVLGQRGATFLLSKPDGTEVLNTAVPPGAALPANPDPAAVRRVVNSGQPYVSGLAINPGEDPPWVAINVPIMSRGKVTYVASLDVMPALGPILRREQLPSGWLATISDASGYILARNRDPQKFVGEAGRPQFLRRVVGSDEGWFPMESRDGVPSYLAFSRVQPVGWTVVVGIPLAVLYAPVRHSTEVLLLLGAAILAVALLLAVLIGARIARPIAGLVRYAEALGLGAPLPFLPTGLRETDVVACSLQRASEELHRNAADRTQAAADLAMSEQRKQVLQQVVLAQEAERTRIARELHDSLGQYLTALQLGLNAAGRSTADDPAATAELAKLRALTSRVGGDINRMAWELRPTALDDLGLQTAIAQYLEEWGERTRLHFDLQFNLGDRRLPQTAETTVYRALQEAVTNVARHAEARNVAVILEIAGSQLQMIVEDDGKGFPADNATAGEAETQHLGLLGIRERLALIDGTLDVESVPGRGTTLFVRVPL